jgi:hypothetical protein
MRPSCKIHPRARRERRYKAARVFEKHDLDVRGLRSCLQTGKAARLGNAVGVVKAMHAGTGALDQEGLARTEAGKSV